MINGEVRSWDPELFRISHEEPGWKVRLCRLQGDCLREREAQERGACVNHAKVQFCRQKLDQQTRARVKLSRITKTCKQPWVVTLKAIEEGTDFPDQ